MERTTEVGVGTRKNINALIKKSANPVEERPGTRWKTALLVCGSALLGATAVALWNHRVVGKIQTLAPAQEVENLGAKGDRHRVKEDFMGLRGA
jgi:hypothetical protein